MTDVYLNSPLNEKPQISISGYVLEITDSISNADNGSNKTKTSNISSGRNKKLH